MTDFQKILNSCKKDDSDGCTFRIGCWALLESGHLIKFVSRQI